MYLIPSNDRHKDREDFDLSLLNFTWKTIEFLNDTVVFKIDWNCASCISVNPEFDHILVNFKNTTENGFLFS